MTVYYRFQSLAAFVSASVAIQVWLTADALAHKIRVSPATHQLGIRHTDSEQLLDSLKGDPPPGQIQLPIYLAAPENLNPELAEPPPVIAVPEQTNTAEEASELSPAPTAWEVDELLLDFSYSVDGFGQENRMLEPTVTGRLTNGDILSLTTGVNTYSQPGTSPVTNTPVRLTWTRKQKSLTAAVGIGVDLFNQQEAAFSTSLETSLAITPNFAVTLIGEYGPHKVNAETLNNQIKALRYGINAFWQVAPDLSLFSLVRQGHYSDGNLEQQSFSRVQYSLGDVTIAANLFSWNYQQNTELASGYFSPQDFLVFSGELAWEANVLEGLNCRISGSQGRQRLSGNWSSALSYGSRCNIRLASDLELDLGYTYSNVVEQSGSSTYSNHEIAGQIRARF